MKMNSFIAVFCLAGFIHLYGGEKVTDQNDTLNSRVVAQVGIIVKDIDKTTKDWAELLGIPAPKWFLTDPVETANTQYHNRPTSARAKLAFIDLGQVQLELIEPVGGPSTWKDHLDQKGEGVHHIAFVIRGMDGQIQVLENRGMPIVQRGDYEGGCYSYIAAEAKLGVVLELLENFTENK